MTTAERFWSKVDKTDSCWLWTAYKLKNGYARFSFEGKPHYAHRVAYILTHGSIPAGCEIDHVKANGCTSTHCVNPAHLEAVTPRENTRRSNAPAGQNSRKTHCNRGHYLGADNIKVTKSGNRACQECIRFHSRLQSAKRRDHSRAQVEMGA